uniref:Uncharacterized protein n=1 Tax=Arundo donax TaxID=35708 RepID=A0A0A9BHA8_ARUDO
MTRLFLRVARPSRMADTSSSRTWSRGNTSLLGLVSSDGAALGLGFWGAAAVVQAELLVASVETACSTLALT